ncbi:unnamed protein product [Chondrus crispus]|uniref:Uncharacterized protein n=1 Tax=Chondrus crispus TaxID=2769 RepID=R7Q5U2_CHOCR|nr:unnamed protein product [Chondrus crispus]CDF32835.1 unnamed protein product [Chondrus crispus]|eukprot:XP_005712636.1 unnamed protein product [Chondrus crispus]
MVARRQARVSRDRVGPPSTCEQVVQLYGIVNMVQYTRTRKTKAQTFFWFAYRAQPKIKGFRS